MQFTYDPTKNECNIAERNLSFERVREFEFASAVIMEDNRRDYGEVRQRALGLLGGRLHALVFVARSSTIRIISLRKANKREEKFYEKEKARSRNDR